MNEWRKIQIKELCSDIIDCVNKTAPISNTPTKYRMLRTSDIRDGFINLENLNCVTEETYNKWTRRGFLQKGDIILTREAPLGEVGLVRYAENFFLGQRLVLLRANPSVCDNRFLLYALQFHDNKQAIIAKGVGATVLHLRVPECEKIEIRVPDLQTQRKIGNILFAYDNLIENNQKQIKLLEEEAQRLYKEWFVDLRFPGYETTPVVNGVPEGWQKYHLKEVIDYEIGGGWGEELPTDRYDCAAYVIRGTDLFDITHGNTLGIPFRYHSRSNLLARMLADGDIVFEVSGGSKTEGVARTALIRSSMLALWEKPAICASFCKLIRPVETRYSQFIFDTLQYMRFSGKTTEYDKRSASSIVNYRWKDFLSKETIVFPSDKVLKKYSLIAESTYQMMICKSISIEKAREARDRLLPKLMSGEIEV